MLKKEQSPKIAIQIRDELKQAFKARLKSVLLYNGSLDSKQYWNIDIFILLTKSNEAEKDLLIIKKI